MTKEEVVALIIQRADACMELLNALNQVPNADTNSAKYASTVLESILDEIKEIEEEKKCS